MPKVKPFRGLLYAKDKAPIAKAATEPYDKISPELQKKYLARHPYNFVRLILDPQSPADNARDNRYTRSARRLNAWIRQGVLRQDAEPAFYLYEQTFALPPAGKKVRRGIIGLLRLEDFARGNVLPHEKTLSKPRKDRLSLLRATCANLEQIFLLYDDARQALEKKMQAWSREKPLLDFKDDKGVRQRLWRIAQKDRVSLIGGFLSGRKLFIADGHHRYTISLKYARQMQRRKAGNARLKENSGWRMATFVNLTSPGLVILPTHRLVSTPKNWNAEAFLQKISPCFRVQPLPGGGTVLQRTQHLLKAMRAKAGKEVCLGMLTRSAAVLLTLRRDAVASRQIAECLEPLFRDLDVAVLHSLVLEKGLGMDSKSVERGGLIAYIRCPEEVASKVARGEFGAGFLLNPTAIKQVQRIALAGHCMPQKSTDFYPKLLSGLVMYDMIERAT